MKALSRFGLALFSALMLAPASADETAVATPELAKPAPGSNGVEVRRVWVLSDPTGYASGNRTREIVVYDLICEEGKMTKASEAFQSTAPPAFGAGWVLRAQTAPNPAAAQDQLLHLLADVCGV